MEDKPLRAFVPANFDAYSARFLCRNSSYVTYFREEFFSVESRRFDFIKNQSMKRF